MPDPISFQVICFLHCLRWHEKTHDKGPSVSGPLRVGRDSSRLGSNVRQQFCVMTAEEDWPGETIATRRKRSRQACCHLVDASSLLISFREVLAFKGSARESSFGPAGQGSSASVR